MRHARYQLAAVRWRHADPPPARNEATRSILDLVGGSGVVRLKARKSIEQAAQDHGEGCGSRRLSR